MKVYVYKTHAGMVGTDESFCIVGDTPLTLGGEQEYAYDHATSYQEQDEDGEWPDGDPEIWLVAVCLTKAEVEDQSGELLCGNDTLEALIARLEADGMVFN
jgi:hypothetical protein